MKRSSESSPRLTMDAQKERAKKAEYRQFPQLKASTYADKEISSALSI